MGEELQASVASAHTDRGTPSPHVYASRNNKLGIAFVLFSAAAFSAKGIFIKLAYGDASLAHAAVDPITLLMMRMGISLPFFLLIGWWSSRGVVPITRREWSALCVLGLIGYYGASLLDFWGLQYITASLGRLILFLNPTFVVLLSALFFGYRIGRRDILALTISYLGIGLLVAHDLSFNREGVLIGGGLVMASALLYAGYLVGAGQMVQRVGSVRFAAYASLASTLAITAHFAVTHSPNALQQSPRVWVLAGAMAMLSTVLPVVLMAEGMRRIGSSKAAIMSSVGPVATIFLGVIFLDERITFLQLVGAALVLAGVLIIVRKKN